MIRSILLLMVIVVSGCGQSAEERKSELIGSISHDVATMKMCGLVLSEFDEKAQVKSMGLNFVVVEGLISKELNKDVESQIVEQTESARAKIEEDLVSKKIDIVEFAIDCEFYSQRSSQVYDKVSPWVTELSTLQKNGS